MNYYTIKNVNTGRAVTVCANSFKEACRDAGWRVSSCRLIGRS